MNLIYVPSIHKDRIAFRVGCRWDRGKAHHAQRNQEGNQRRWFIIGYHNSTRSSQVIEQTTWSAIRSMYRTQEAPGFWKKFSTCCSPHFLEESTSVDGSKMRYKPQVINLIGNNGEARSLLQMSHRFRIKVTGRQKILHWPGQASRSEELIRD